MSLYKLGDLALARKQPEQAQARFAEDLHNAEHLVAEYGETVTSLEVLAAAHLGFAKATQALARPATEVAQHAQQARDLFERLSLSMPHETRYAAGLAELDALQSEIDSKINVSE